MRTLIGGARAVAMLAVLATGAGAQTLQIAVDQSPVGLDPHLATAFSIQLVNSAIYEGLTAIAADLRVVPALAASAGLRFNIVPEAATRQLGLTGGIYQLLPGIEAATALSA